jgi:hypothetical protein
MPQLTPLDYANGGFPAIAIATQDENRAMSSVASALSSGGYKTNLWIISATGGLRDLRTKAAIDPAASYAVAFDRTANTPKTLLIVLDFQHVIKNAPMYRALLNALPRCKSNGVESMIALFAPSWNLPAEIKNSIPVLSDPLPSREELGISLNTCARSLEYNVPDAERIVLLNGASGLTWDQAEGAFALAWTGERFDPQVVIGEKMKLVKQSGYLEVIQPVDPSELGGLGLLREYITEEVLPNADTDLRIRGLLFVGTPGCGKSLTARVVGAMLRVPVLKCDIGSLMSHGVGDSEAAMRSVLQLVDAVAPCVLFLDEAEKGVGGHASSAQSDGGTTLRLVGTLLTWQNDHDSEVLTIATVNDYSKLPAEMTRAGRFDATFFVDLPTRAERVDIAQVHLNKFSKSKSKEHAQTIADLTPNWTGAEIAEMVRSAARRTGKKFTAGCFEEAAKHIKPISLTRKSEIDALRAWGTGNLRPANSPEIQAVPFRKIKAAR